MIEVRVNESDLRDIERMTRAFRDGAPKVLSRALNKAGQRMRRHILQYLSKAMGLPQKAVRVWKLTGTRKATWSRLQVIIGVSAWRPSLSQFAPRQTKGGVTRRAGGGRRTIPGAFVIKKGGRKKVLKRFGASKKPITLRGPSPAQVLEDDERAVAEIQQRAATEVSSELGQQLEKLIKTRR